MSRCVVRAAALLAIALATALAAAPDAPACAGPVRCIPPPEQPTTTAPGRIGFGALGSVARLLPAEAYGIDALGRPVTAFAQAGEGRLRLVVVRWTADGAVDRSFGDGDSGAGVAQRFVDVTSERTGTPRIGATSDGGLVVGVALSGGTVQRLALIRLDAAGRPVDGFGDGGVVVLEGMELVAGPQELSDGALAVGGASGPGGRVVVLGADGRRDARFGAGGAVTLAARPAALAPTTDGLIVGLEGSSQVAVLRLSRTGAPDATAGPGGIQASALPGALVTAPVTLRVAPDGTATVVGSAQRPPSDASRNPEPTSELFAARFPRVGDGAVFAGGLPLGAATVDAAGRVLVGSTGGTRIRRYTIDGRLDRTFGRAGVVSARLPAGVARSFSTLGTLGDGAIVAGGPGRWSGTPAPTFLRLRPDGTRDSRFGPRLLTLRQTSARLGAHDVIALRVHCDDTAQRRCVVRLRAGARTVRAFVAPGGDRRIPVRVGKTAARRIEARGRAIVRVNFTAIDEAVRVEALDAPVVVRRR